MRYAAIVFAAVALQMAAIDQLLDRARRLSDPKLAEEAKLQAQSYRASLDTLFVRAVRDPASADANMALARRIAVAINDAWGDAFFIRQVGIFAALTPSQRQSRIWADSVRRAGIQAFSRSGTTPAVAAWRRALERYEQIPDSAGMSAVHANIGAAFLTDGMLDSAEVWLQRARSLAARTGHRQVEANALLLLAGVEEGAGRPAAARSLYSQAAALSESIGDYRGVAASFNNLGLLARAVGDVSEARRHFYAALALNRRDGRDEIAGTNLVNIAALATADGDFAAAEPLYLEALGTWQRAARDVDAAAALQGLGEMEIRRGDYPAAVKRLTEASAIYERTGPRESANTVQRAIAAALSAMGDVQGGADVMRRLQASHTVAPMPEREQAAISLLRADLDMQTNALASAEQHYAAAVAQYARAGDRVGEANAREGQGILMLERGNHAGALGMLRSAQRAHATAGDDRAAALVRAAAARALAAQRDSAAALRELQLSADELRRLGDPVALAFILAQRGALELGRRMPSTAAAVCRDGLAQLAARVAPEVRSQLHLCVAKALLAQRLAEDAARELRAAIASIESTARAIPIPERRSAYLSDKWEAYTLLAEIEQARGAADMAFEVSEKLRAREMLEVLNRGRIAAPRDTPAALIDREQDLRRQIDYLTRILEGREPARELRGPDVSRADNAVRETLLAAQARYAETLLEIRERAPGHASLVWSEPASWRRIARRLRTDEALVEFLLGERGSLAFVVTNDTLRVFELGVSRSELAATVAFVRGTLDQRAVQMDSLWRAPLRRLNAQLIAPLEEQGFLAGKHKLTIVPHLELHYLPFAALLGEAGDDRFLVQRYELTITPSASVWLALGDRTRRASNGTLVLSPLPERLPAARREAAAIRNRIPNAEILEGRRATKEMLLRRGTASSVLHFATYGVLNKQNPLFSYVELASDGNQAGRLDVHEILGMNFSAQLVVLSACVTGLGSGAASDVPAGDDWISLTRAFLHAGAERVVATLWPVEDAATAWLMEKFYDGFAPDVDAGRALAEAQRALLADPRTRHPFYWAGFTVHEGARRTEAPASRAVPR